MPTGSALLVRPVFSRDPLPAPVGCSHMGAGCAFVRLTHGLTWRLGPSGCHCPHMCLPLSGVAIYTGMETKMALNYQSKSQKRSAVEK